MKKAVTLITLAALFGALLAVAQGRFAQAGEVRLDPASPVCGLRQAAEEAALAPEDDPLRPELERLMCAVERMVEDDETY